MTEMEELCMIADIPLMNKKWSIADLETRIQSQNLNLNLEPRNLNRIYYRSEKTEPKPRTQNRICYRFQKAEPKPEPKTQTSN